MSDVQKQFEARMGRFGRVRRGIANTALACGCGVAALCVGIGSLVLLRGWQWTASPFANAAIDAVPALASAVLLFRALLRLVLRWERRRGVLAEAFRAEALAGGLNSRLISAVDFLAQKRFTPLTEAVIGQARLDLERRFEELLDRSARNRLLVRFALLLVLFLLLGSTPWFGFARAGRTIALCAINLREALFPTRYELFPGTKICRIGSRVEAGLRFTRFRYPEVTMLSEASDREGTESTALKVDSAGRAAVTLESAVERLYRIRFAFGNRVTDPMALTFTTAPMIENMQVELVYPLYTRQVPKELEGIVDRLTALAGTRINLGFVFTKPLKSAVLTFDDGSRMPLDVVNRFASISFVHSQERAASLQVEDIHGFALDSPHSIEFGLTADNPPKLIVQKSLRQDMPLTLDEFAGFSPWARVEDDFGATRCAVRWRHSTVEEPGRVKAQGEPVERAFIPPRKNALAVFENLFREQAQSAEAGDLFSFQFEGFDNREPKPQSAVSTMFSIFIKGQGLEAVGSAEGGVDIFGPRGGGPRQGPVRQYRAAEGSLGIKMPSALTTAESYKSDYRSDRGYDTRGEVRGGKMGSVAADYGAAAAGAK